MLKKTVVIFGYFVKLMYLYTLENNSNSIYEKS